MNAKKVGIITSYLDFNKNYGGVLQAYALSKQIQLLGYKPYIMPYIYEHIPVDKRAKNPVWVCLRAIREHISPKRRKFLGQKKLHRVMMNFVNGKMPVFQKERMTCADLTDIAPDFFAFICGSDQVWSTKLQKDHCDPGMFLQFVPNGVKKIAYAPSMGSTRSVSEQTAQEIQNALKDYVAISAREGAGQTLIEQITGRSCPLVLDPTLLLEREKWNEIACVPKNLPSKYILVYRFGNLSHTYEKIKEIQANTLLPIIELPSSLISLSDDFDKRYDIDPGMFIGLIRNASLVCTDSFHATVFSILNETPFVTFYRQDPATPFNMNARIDDLLSITNLQSRLVAPGGEINYDNLFRLNFDFAHKSIDALRNSSLAYLKEALDGGNAL